MYSTWGPGGKPPCASGTYSKREAGARSPYVPFGGAGAYVSAEGVAEQLQLGALEQRPTRGLVRVRVRARVRVRVRAAREREREGRQAGRWRGSTR